MRNLSEPALLPSSSFDRDAASMQFAGVSTSNRGIEQFAIFFETHMWK
jgi:hypothetical protein